MLLKVINNFWGLLKNWRWFCKIPAIFKPADGMKSY